MKTRTQKNIDLGSGSIPKLLFRLALPAVVAQIINMLYNLIDRIYVGGIKEIGTPALAGLGVCFPIVLIVSAFSVLIGLGGAPLAAIKLGEKNREGAERILNNGVVLLGVIGVVMTVLLLIFSEQLLRLFGAPDDSIVYGNAYLRIYAIGSIFVLFSLGLNSFISTQGFALTSMLTVAIGAVLNIALDPLFIFVFDMGVRGAAFATILSQAVSCVWVIVFFCSKRTLIRIRPKLFRLKAGIVLPILALGVSPFIMQVTESAVQIVFNIQLHRYTAGSTDYTAALTVMMSVMQIITLPMNGIGTGAQPLISYNYGAGNSDRIKQTIRYLIFVSLTLCAAVWLVCLIRPGVFAAIFSATAAVTEIVNRFMPIFMMGTIMFFAQFALQNAFLALGQAKISMALALLRKVILLIPLTFLLPLALGVKGIFLAEGIADLAAGAVTATTFLIAYRGILRRREEFLRSQAPVEANSDEPLETTASDVFTETLAPDGSRESSASNEPPEIRP